MELTHIGENPTDLTEPLPVTFTGEESAHLAGVLMLSQLAVLNLAEAMERSDNIPDEITKTTVGLANQLRDLLHTIGQRQHGLPDDDSQTTLQ